MKKLQDVLFTLFLSLGGLIILLFFANATYGFYLDNVSKSKLAEIRIEIEEGQLQLQRSENSYWEMKKEKESQSLDLELQLLKAEYKLNKLNK